MKRVFRNPGFTLLEMLISTLLFGMLVTLLTGIFNQGNRAWDVGRASVVDLGSRQQTVAEQAHHAANHLPRAAGGMRLLSAWDDQGRLRTDRPLREEPSFRPVAGKAFAEVQLEGASAHRRKTCRAHVMSAGPDGKWGTADDLEIGAGEDFE